jgi:hypothetical protein
MGGRGQGEREQRRRNDPFSKRRGGDLRGVQLGDEARPRGIEGVVGAGHGGVWRRKGGLARAPTQARWRWAVRRAGIGEEGGLAQMGHCGITGRLLADVGRSGENGKISPTQEAQCRFHNYSKKFKTIELI